jgi:ABC-2 type transport system permease protein
MLLVSAWARRAVFLWAALPIAAIGILEKIIFNTTHFANFLEYRLSGPEPYAMGAPSNSMSQGPAAGSISQGAHSMHTMSTVDPAKFLTTPGLWLGLIVTVALLAATVHLRRSQSPL